MIASMFASLPHCALNIFAIGKRVNYGGEFSLPIFIFMYLKMPLDWLKNKITMIEKSLNETKILFKVKCIQISYKKCLIWPAIERVRYREVSARW